MALTSIERVYKVTVDAAEAVRNLQKVARATESIDASLTGFASQLKTIGLAIGSALGVHAVVEGIGNIIEGFDQLSKDAQKVGIAAEDLQRLRYAADLSGVSAEKMDKAIGSLATTMTHLSSESDEAAGILRKIGVSGADSPLQALEKVADHFARLPDGVQKTAESIALFGKKVGMDMVPLLNGGGKALAELAGEADKFGGVISGRVLGLAEEFNDNLSRLHKTSAGAAAQFTAGLLPALKSLSSLLVDATTDGEGFVDWGREAGGVLITVAESMIELQGVIQILGVKFAQAKAEWSAETDDQTAAAEKLGDEVMTDIGAKIERRLQALRQSFADARKDIGKPAPKTGDEVDKDKEKEREAQAQRELIVLMRAEADAEKAAGEANVKRIEEELALRDKLFEITRAQSEALEDQKQISVGEDAARAAGAVNQLSVAEAKHRDLVNEQTDAAIAWNDEQQKSSDLLALWTSELTDADEHVRRYAKAMLDAQEKLHHQHDETDALNEGFKRFVDNIASGTESVKESFSQMAKSIIADLLKIWVQRYIIQALFPTTAQVALGGVFDGGEVIPFGSGGVVSGPLRVPMALMGEAGPEAVMPLRRGSDGRLGVSAASGGFNVAIHNYADATVSARRGAGGDLEVIIERTREAIAADFRRGGTLVARSAERAYGLSRGSAAAF